MKYIVTGLLALLLCTSSAFAAVTFDNSAFELCSGSCGAMSLVVAANSNITLVGMMSWGSTSPTNISMTWNGSESMTAVPGATTSATYKTIWFCLQGASSGTHNVTASYTNSTNGYMMAASFYNAGGCTNYRAFSGSPASPTAESITMTGAAGTSAAIAAGIDSMTNMSSGTWSSGTFINNTGAGCCFFAYARGTGAQTFTVTMSVTAILDGIEIQAPAGGPCKGGFALLKVGGC